MRDLLLIDKIDFYIVLPVIILSGWLLGMVVNYLADVLPRERRFVRPSCFYCNETLGWINYLFLPRQCKKCGRHRRPRAILVEVFFILICIYLWMYPPERLGFPVSILLLVYFILVTIIDIEHRLIMHSISFLGALLCLVTGIWLHGVRVTFLGGVIGFGIMLGVYLLGLGFTQLLMRWHKYAIIEEEALGFGDVTLSGVIGLLLGWPGVLAAIILGIIIAGLVSVLYVLVKAIRHEYRVGLSLPYGPFLVAATFGLLVLKEISLK